MYGSNPAPFGLTRLRAGAAQNLESEILYSAALHGKQAWRIWEAVRRCPVEVLAAMPDALRQRLDQWLEAETDEYGEDWVRDVGMARLNGQAFATTGDGLRLAEVMRRIDAANRGQYSGTTQGEEGGYTNERDRDQSAAWLEPLDEAIVELHNLMDEMITAGRVPNIRVNGKPLVKYVEDAMRKHACNNAFAEAVLDAISVPPDIPPFLLVFQYLDAHGINTAQSAPQGADALWEQIKAGPKDASDDEPAQQTGDYQGLSNPYSVLEDEGDDIHILAVESVQRAVLKRRKKGGK